MPNPVKRHSKSRRNKRRSHDFLSLPASSICPRCKNFKRPHYICNSCGYYKGMQILKI